MKTFMTLLLTFTTLFSGLASQIDFILNPQKYNAITLDTSRVPSPVEEPETDDFVQLSQVRMHYRVYGKGKPPLVLIHGNGGSVNSLKEAASYLANDFTVYLPESRCYGAQRRRNQRHHSRFDVPGCSRRDYFNGSEFAPEDLQALFPAGRCDKESICSR